MEFGYYDYYFEGYDYYIYYYDFSETEYLNIDVYYDEDNEIFCIDIYYINENSSSADPDDIDIRTEWTSDEIGLFDTYFFAGAADYVPCYIPEGGELTDLYFEEYECLSIEAIIDTTLAE